VALHVQPRVEVVAHLDEVEAGPLGQHGLADQLRGPNASAASL
jgi:hypothetical protein